MFLQSTISLCELYGAAGVYWLCVCKPGEGTTLTNIREMSTGHQKSLILLYSRPFLYSLVLRNYL